MRRYLHLIILVLFVSACGQDDGVVRIRIWHQKIGTERAFFENVVDRYNQEHTDRRIEILYRENEDLRNLFIMASVGGQGPELVFGPSDNVSVFAITGAIMPLDTVFDASFLDAFTEDGLISWEDQLWMVGDQVGNHLTFVYNIELLPTPPETTDQMIAVLDSLSDPDGDGTRDLYGMTWNYTEPFYFIPFLTGFGGWMMDEEGNPTLDTPATVQAIRFILDLRDKYQLIPRESDYNVAETLFKEGKSAAIINGPWAWAGYGDAGIDYGLAPIPRISSTGLWSAPLVSAKGYSINANVGPELLPIVREVVRYLTSAEIQMEMALQLATVPVLKDVRRAPELLQNEMLQASIRQIELGRQMPTEPELRQIWDGMRGPYQLVMNGAVTPEEGARLMQREAEKRIADTFL